MSQFRCIIHGSFGKHFAEIQHAANVFRAAGIEVLAPKPGEILDQTDGFGLFADEVGQDPRLIELYYLHNLKKLGNDGFSYFVDPEGYIGVSASYELGIAQLTNTRCFFSNKPKDHPVYVHGRAVWSPERLAEYITDFVSLPAPTVRQNERRIHALWEDLMVPGSVVAAGAIIEHQPKRGTEKEILLVKTHKWGDRFSIVGGKVRRNERVHDALLREVREETGLKGTVGDHLLTFDQIKSSGYYQLGVQHIFIDNVVQVASKNVVLNDEAEDYVWARPQDALAQLDLEPNARLTVEYYARSLVR